MLHVRTTTLDAVGFFLLLSPLTVIGSRNLFAAQLHQLKLDLP